MLHMSQLKIFYCLENILLQFILEILECMNIQELIKGLIEDNCVLVEDRQRNHTVLTSRMGGIKPEYHTTLCDLAVFLDRHITIRIQFDGIQSLTVNIHIRLS